MLKIDAFNHIWQADYYKALASLIGAMAGIARRSETQPMMMMLDERFRLSGTIPRIDRLAETSRGAGANWSGIEDIFNEARYAIVEAFAAGIQVYTNVNGLPFHELRSNCAHCLASCRQTEQVRS